MSSGASGRAAAGRPAAVSVAWSRCGDADCIRLRGLAPGAEVEVRPVVAAAPAGQFPAMAGRLIHDGGDLCFVPRFPFIDGRSYTVTVAGAAVAMLARPRPPRLAVTEVLAIYPTAAEVPRNLLRFYLWFSAPMSEGGAAQHVGMVDAVTGDPLTGALLPTASELWSGDRRRLTVLLDPARIKRGLAAHREVGYPLRRGEPFRLAVGAGLRDAAGFPLRSPAGRRYAVGPDERRRVDPGEWDVVAPAAGTRQPLAVIFGRSLDHGLLRRCLHVAGPDGRPVAGLAEPGPEERSWRLTPSRPWAPGSHQLIVDPVLEDLAGNSVSRVFDRDLSRPGDDPQQASPVILAFRSC